MVLKGQSHLCTSQSKGCRASPAIQLLNPQLQDPDKGPRLLTAQGKVWSCQRPSQFQERDLPYSAFCPDRTGVG